MKTVAIIGGNGFLGKNLNVVLKTQYNCVNLSRSNGFDLLNFNTCLTKLKTIAPDIIINLAAHVGSLSYVSKNQASILTDNIRMYTNLYELILTECKDAYVINTLANCSYPGHCDVQKESEWWNGEIHESVLPFGLSKKVLWALSETYKNQYNIKSLSVILPNAYGIYDHTDINRVHAMNGMIIRMISAMRNNDDRFVVWGTGSPIREWIYMPDAAELIKLCLESNISEPYINFGQKCGISIKQSAEMIKNVLNYTGDIIFDTTKMDGAPIKVLSGDILKKYFPNFNFTNYIDGIKSTTEYYKEIL